MSRRTTSRRDKTTHWIATARGVNVPHLHSFCNGHEGLIAGTAPPRW